MDVVEAVGERRGPELAEAVAQVHPAGPLAAEAEPLAQAQRRAIASGLTASSVAASRRCSALSKYVRTRPLASRSP